MAAQVAAADGDRRGLRWAWRSLREVGSFEGADIGGAVW
jgi:hypothetical protein